MQYIAVICITSGEDCYAYLVDKETYDKWNASEILEEVPDLFALTSELEENGPAGSIVSIEADATNSRSDALLTALRRPEVVEIQTCLAY